MHSFNLLAGSSSSLAWGELVQSSGYLQLQLSGERCLSSSIWQVCLQTEGGKNSQTDTLFIHKWHCRQPICVAAVFFPHSPLERACDVFFVGALGRGRIIEGWRRQTPTRGGVVCLHGNGGGIVRGERGKKKKNGRLLSAWQVRGAENAPLICMFFPPKVPAHYARSKAINKTNRRALHFRWHMIGWSLKGKHKGYHNSLGHLSCLLDLHDLIRQMSAEESGDIST